MENPGKFTFQFVQRKTFLFLFYIVHFCGNCFLMSFHEECSEMFEYSERLSGMKNQIFQHSVWNLLIQKDFFLCQVQGGPEVAICCCAIDIIVSFRVSCRFLKSHKQKFLTFEDQFYRALIARMYYILEAFITNITASPKLPDGISLFKINDISVDHFGVR